MIVLENSKEIVKMYLQDTEGYIYLRVSMKDHDNTILKINKETHEISKSHMLDVEFGFEIDSEGCVVIKN